ncbi:hypothetical protein DL93DRAFT_2040499, partial [Clavulina sp. PMI_390]
SVSPQPPPYRASSSSTYNASRDGDLSSTDRYGRSDEKRQNSYGSVSDSSAYPRAPAPARYGNRSAIGDPYARGGNADSDRAALFSGFDASSRGQGGPPNRFANDGPSGSGAGSRYGNSDEPREFQTQEEEDEEVEGIRQQIRGVKQESVQSTRNALRIAREAEETGRNTLARLGDQSEKLASTERYVDQGKVHAARAEDKTDELKKLNRSIFRPAITFNKDAKRAAQEAKIKARHEEEQLSRERGMGDVRDSQNRLGRAGGYGAYMEGEEEGGEEEGIGRRRPMRSEAEQNARREQRKRYQFEATASDDELEDELDDNLDEISRMTKSLKAIAIAAGEELDAQNDRIDNIANKTTKLGARVDITTNRV